MVSRIEGVPVIAKRRDRVPARLYNLWRRSRMHLGVEQSLSLPGMKEMELILEAHAWVVVDHNRNQVPVLAWVDFQVSPQRGLHESVPCTLNYYHFMASSLRGKVVNAMGDELEKRLKLAGW